MYTDSAAKEAFINSCKLLTDVEKNEIIVHITTETKMLDSVMRHAKNDITNWYGQRTLESDAAYAFWKAVALRDVEHINQIIADSDTPTTREQAENIAVKTYQLKKETELPDKADWPFYHATIHYVFDEGVGLKSETDDIHAGNLGRVLNMNASIMGMAREKNVGSELTIMYDKKGMKLMGNDIDNTTGDKDERRALKKELGSPQHMYGFKYDENLMTILETLKEIPATEIQIEPPLGASTNKQMRKIHKTGVLYGTNASESSHIPGETVHLIGVVLSRSPPKRAGARANERETYLCVLAIKRIDDTADTPFPATDLLTMQNEADQDGDKFLEKLSRSFAPQVWGNKLAKIGILMAMVGTADFGNTTEGDTIRGNMMLYIVSEPGDAKGEMFKWIPYCRARSTITDAPSDTPEGLMFGQSADRTMIYPGPIATHAVIVLDELSKAHYRIFQTLNTAIERQVLFYNKTGFYVERPHRFTIIGGGNPFNNVWNPDASLAENFKRIPMDHISRYHVVRIVNKAADDEPKARHIDEAAFNELDRTELFSRQWMRGWVMHCVDRPIKISKTFREKAIMLYCDAAKTARLNEWPAVKPRQQYDFLRMVMIITNLMGKDEVDDNSYGFALKYYTDCQATLGLDTQMPLQGISHSTTHENKVATCLNIIRENYELGKSRADQEEVVKAMIKKKHWADKTAAQMYIENLRAKNILYEPVGGWISVVNT